MSKRTIYEFYGRLGRRKAITTLVYVVAAAATMWVAVVTADQPPSLAILLPLV